MEDLKYCKLCLVTDVKMFSMNTPSIRDAYSQLVQIVICEASQMYVCYECVSLLLKYEEFRSKCITAFNVLSSIDVDHSKITKEVLQNINRKYYKLDSKLEHCSILLCDNNDQYLLPRDCINSENILKDEMYSSLKSELVKPEMKMDIKVPVPSNSHDEIKIELEPKMKCETGAFIQNNSQDQYRGLNDMFLESNDYSSDNNDLKSEIRKKKQLVVPKLKKRKKNTTKSSNTDSQNENTSFSKTVLVSNDQVSSGNDLVLKIKKKKRTRVPKLNKKTGKSNFEKSILDKFKLIGEDYMTVVLQTPDDAKTELLLKKESKNYNNNPYKCTICYKGFGTTLTFNNHMMKHNPEYGSWECEYCHVRFPENRFLRKHKFSCHSYKFSCLICPYVCTNSSQAESHINFHKGKKYPCLECGLNFSLPNSLLTHKHLKHPTQDVCELCGAVYATEKGLHLHKMISHRQESNTEIVGPKCEECDVQFATETAFKRHLVLSSKHTVSNGCESCGESFNTEEELKIHAKIHPMSLRYRYKDKVPAACKLCGIWLTSHIEYRSHMKSQHPLWKKEPFGHGSCICEVCGKVFKNAWMLQAHQFRHSSKRSYECRQCGKTFKSPNVLYQHENMHTRKRVFQCDLCQKEYTTKNALVKHIKVHFGMRRFTCSVCDKTFVYQYEMRMHIDYVHHKKPWPKRDRTNRRAKEESYILDYCQ